MKEVRKFEIDMSDNAVIAAEKEEDYVVVDYKLLYERTRILRNSGNTRN